MVLCVKVELAPDVENITNVVEEFCNRNRNKERLYLHFSGGNAKYFSTKQINWVVVGHGVNNAKLEVDKIEKDPRTNRDVIHTNTPDGDCLVGTQGQLFSVHDLKHILLLARPDRVVLTLDMCRDIERGRNKYLLQLR